MKTASRSVALTGPVHQSVGLAALVVIQVLTSTGAFAASVSAMLPQANPLQSSKPSISLELVATHSSLSNYEPPDVGGPTSSSGTGSR